MLPQLSGNQKHQAMSNLSNLLKKKERGSKNKSKDINEDNFSANTECTIPFFDLGDVCNICDFSLNDPIKKMTKIIQCQDVMNMFMSPV